MRSEAIHYEDYVSPFTYEKKWSWKKLTAPSFRNSMNAHLRKTSWLEKQQGGNPSFITKLKSKVFQKSVFDILKIPQPALVAGPNKISKIIKTNVFGPDRRLILKPDIGKSSFCIYSLDVVNGRIIFPKGEESGQFIKSAIRACRKHKFADNWILEQNLRPTESSALHEAKTYSFLGRAGITLLNRYDETGKKSIWLDLNMRPIVSGKRGAKMDLPALEGMTPGIYNELLIESERISAQLPIPFCRIDLYFDGSNIYAGELTPWPANFGGFTDEIDSQLGVLYEVAEAEMLRRGTQSETNWTVLPL